MQSRPSKSGTARQISGAQGEAAALELLIKAGMKHLASNVRFRGGELDLVMVEQTGRDPTLVFVEVRLRKSAAYGGAAASVDTGKQHRLVVAAEQYLLKHHPHRPPRCRFDLVTIDGDGKTEWLRDAFGAFG